MNQVRRSDAIKARVFDLVLGAFVGVLTTGAVSMYTVMSRVTALEVEVRFLRKDVDRALSRQTGSLTSELQEAAGDIERARRPK